MESCTEALMCPWVFLGRFTIDQSRSIRDAGSGSAGRRLVARRPATVDYSSPTIARQSPFDNPSSLVSHRSSIINHQSSIINHH
jgi:hypothetical protein